MRLSVTSVGRFRGSKLLKTSPAGALVGDSVRKTVHVRDVTPRTKAVAENALNASVLPLVDRTKRIVSMLDRWETENVADEPEWDVGDIEPLALRAPSRT